MKLYYYKDPNGNFGDDLNPWIWGSMLPGFFDDSDETIFVGIGTLLTSRLNNRFPNARRYIVFGSGAGYGPIPDINNSWDFICVRGPRTAKTLNLLHTVGITDPGILINSLHRYKSDARHSVSYMPHHVSMKKADWREICRRANINFINPCDSVDSVLESISSSSLLLTEAMHGAIAADALRKPWIPIRGYRHISEFKWHDWCESVGLVYQPIDLPRVFSNDPFSSLSVKEKTKTLAKHALISVGKSSKEWEEPVPVFSTEHMMDSAARRLDWIARRVEPCISTDMVFLSRLSQLQDKLHAMRTKYNSHAGAKEI